MKVCFFKRAETRAETTFCAQRGWQVTLSAASKKESSEGNINGNTAQLLEKHPWGLQRFGDQICRCWGSSPIYHIRIFKTNRKTIKNPNERLRGKFRHQEELATLKSAKYKGT